MNTIFLLCIIIVCSSSKTMVIAANTTAQASVKIVGGQSATGGQFPYQVSIYFGGYCGGSLISTRHVLTAAHCTNTRTAPSFSVRAGSLYRNNGGQVVGVSQIIQHPSFNPSTVDNDIAILVLSSPVTLSNTVALVGVASTTPSSSTGIGTVSGYGVLSEGGPTAASLQYANVPIVNQLRCLLSYPGRLTSNMICAGYGAGGVDACQGDSGGPLVLRDQNTQVGIVSFGDGCARPNAPGVYTNVARYNGWISSIIESGTGNSSACSNTNILSFCNPANQSLFCRKLLAFCGLSG